MLFRNDMMSYPSSSSLLRKEVSPLCAPCVLLSTQRRNAGASSATHKMGSDDGEQLYIQLQSMFECDPDMYDLYLLLSSLIFSPHPLSKTQTQEDMMMENRFTSN